MEDLNNTINYYINQLEQYTFDELCTKPSPASWSLGQMYLHLIADTNFYIEEIKICITNNDNQFKEAAPAAKAMFLNNSLPDEDVIGDPSNAAIPQPGSKDDLTNGFISLKDELNKLSAAISCTTYKGKTKHPGLNYFNAEEWLQFAYMHFRHHLRQKKRIDAFLTSVK